MRWNGAVDYPSTLALAGRIFTKDDAIYEIVEVYCGNAHHGSVNAMAATVRHPRRNDWEGAEIFVFRLPELLEGLMGGPGVPPLPRDMPCSASHPTGRNGNSDIPSV